MTLYWILARRVAGAILVLLALSLVLFVAIETLPGDFASASAPRFMPPDLIAQTREEMGLTVDPVVRYVAWLSNAAKGDFGLSWTTGDPIGPMLVDRLGATLVLGAFAASIALPIGFGTAVLAVIHRGGYFDRGTSLVSLALISLPEFLVAYALMAIFVVAIPVFPAHIMFSYDMPLAARFMALFLPAMSLAIVAIAPVLRISRASLIAVLSTDYVLSARLKGLPVWRIVMRHALPNVAAPIVNMAVLVIANFLVGAFVVEQIFSYPGIGSAMITAVKFRDVPVVLAIGLIFAVLFVVLNLMANLISILSTPRLRDPMRHK